MLNESKMMIKCSLDEDGCIDLLTVLRIINKIDQEQAWAICYEIGLLMQRLTPKNCAIIDSLDQIQVNQDGFIHEKSLIISPTNQLQTQAQTNNHNNNHHHHNSPVRTPITSLAHCNSNEDIHLPETENFKSHQQQQLQPQPPTPPTPPITPELNELLRRRPALNESELVASLGVALFWALDYGIPDDEERKLSIALECFIIQSHQSKLSLSEVLAICINRLPIATKSNADSHYKSICQSLVSDTLELSMFLEKIYTASMELSDITLDVDCRLEQNNHKHHHIKSSCDISDKDLSELGEPLASLRALRINDWARLWMQVIRELRQRGRFKQALLVN